MTMEASNKVKVIRTRFPPEPNGYLHIGHLKAMLKDFEPGNRCILRFDDTNPLTEKQKYVDAAIRDVTWLGFEPAEITYTSDYFDRLYECAIQLIETGLAYVDSTPAKEMSRLRYDGIPTKDRDRSIESSLTIFNQMKNGEHPDGSYVLRLKIKADHPNTSMRDPIAYRIKHARHYRTGDKWCIYPSYDFSHSLVDSFEKIDWSYCTREFFIRRDQYYWHLDQLNMHRPKVLEFSRLVISDVLLSKRKILAKIADPDDPVTGLDDPSLFTLAGLRNRGYPPKALIYFCKKCVSYVEGDGGAIPLHTFDYYVREYFNAECKRRFAVCDPLKVNVNAKGREIIRPDSFDPHSTIGRIIKIPDNPVVYIERSDFRDTKPERKYKRLAPGKEIRLKYFTVAKYDSHELESVTLNALDKNKTKGAAIQWLLETDMIKMPCYDPENGKHSTIFVEHSVPKSAGTVIQFERLGYYKVLTNNALIKVTSLKSKYP